MKKEPVKVKEADAFLRKGNFEEVVSGYSEKEALREAARCLQCKAPACIDGCPVNIDIKSFIGHLVKKDYQSAYFKIREKNNFPSICGRVCPAEYQCRNACVLSRKNQPYASEESINIHFLERFVGDFGKRNSSEAPRTLDKKLAQYKVAVVGSGPAGLCCAGELTRIGIRVVVFEALQTFGGVLRYGIPPFRLPREVLNYEIAYLAKMGVTFVPNFIVGRSKAMDALLKEGFAAVFLGLGAGVPAFLGVPGENLCNIYSANEFLTRVNLMSAYRFPEYHTPVNIGKHAVIIGGGNTAMDAARVVLRLQVMQGLQPDTTIVYRRTETELPARRLEIEHAKQEGVKFSFLTQPVSFAGDQDKFVKSMRCLRCRLGEPDNSGRRMPVPIEGSEFEVPCDLAVIAIGLGANRVLTGATPELKTDKHFDLIVDKETMETSVRGVFAGGDIVGGEGTVIEAMGMAKRAARGIVDYLLTK